MPGRSGAGQAASTSVSERPPRTACTASAVCSSRRDSAGAWPAGAARVLLSGFTRASLTSGVCWTGIDKVSVRKRVGTARPKCADPVDFRREKGLDGARGARKRGGGAKCGLRIPPIAALHAHSRSAARVLAQRRRRVAALADADPQRGRPGRAAGVRAHPLPAGGRRLPLPRQRQHLRVRAPRRDRGAQGRGRRAHAGRAARAGDRHRLRPQHAGDRAAASPRCSSTRCSAAATSRCRRSPSSPTSRG